MIYTVVEKHVNFDRTTCTVMSLQGNIQTLTAGDLDKYKAHAWLLSPPCQPYTRQGLLLE